MIRRFTFSSSCNHILILLFLLPELSICVFGQDYLNVRFANGLDKNKLITSVDKITFNTTADEINFYLNDAGLITNSINDITRFTFGSSGSGGPLPIELTSFAARINGLYVLLAWKTAAEINCSAFIIEKLINASWTKIGEVRAAGNSNSPKDYSYTDSNPGSVKLSYRLKILDNDGSFKYSEIVTVDNSLPRNFTVSQNYPNPFNPATTFNFTLPAAGNVKILIYDVTGSEISLLKNESQEAGNYSISWDGRNRAGNAVPSGVYLCRVKYNTAVIDKKILLVK